MEIKICKCGGIMNYDSYFKAYVCSSCGKMRRISKGKALKRDNLSELGTNGMTEQELKECITEVKYSDMPKPAKKKIMNVLYGELHKKDWIPCSERMPQKHIDVLVSFGDEDPVIAWYSEVNKHWKNSSTDNVITADVLAWQPLPEPYMRGGD